MNKKAFLLVDSLVCLIITICISALCIYTFNQVDSYHESYKLYYEDINDNYSNIYHSLTEIDCISVKNAATNQIIHTFAHQYS